MTHRHAGYSVICGALLFCTAFIQAEQSHRATSSNGALSVEFPFPFEEQHHSRDTLAGDVQTVIYRGTAPRAIFGMSVTHLPGMAITFAGHGSIMAQARDTILKDYGVDDAHQRYEKTSFAGHDARKLVYDSTHAPEPVADIHGEALFFFVEDVLVTLNAAYATGDTAMAEEAERFFQSYSEQKKLAER